MNEGLVQSQEMLVHRLCKADCRTVALHDTIQHPDCVKRFEAYGTIGGLSKDVTGETVELSVAQRIWGLIVEVINIIAGFIACDLFELIDNAINNNNQMKAVKQAFDRLELAGAVA